MIKKTIIMGEHHADPSTRLFVKQNIQTFINEGVSIFGFEHGENTNLKTEIEWLEEDVDFKISCCMQMVIYTFFNKEYKKIQKSQQCNQQLLSLFKTIAKNNMEYQGLDVDIGNRWSLEATPQWIWNQYSKLAESNDYNTIMKVRDTIIVKNLLKHPNKQGINILGLAHLNGVQELLIESIGEEAVRNNYEFVVVRGKALTDEDIQNHAKNIPIPAWILDSDNPSDQLDELFKNLDEPTHLKKD